MKIAGINKNSFVDMKGMISYVVFTAGCNLNCWYCHNRHILNDVDDLYDENKVLEDITKRKGFIDIVVISGGEPTLQKDLLDYIKRIRKIGLKVKLDSNGTKPEVIKRLLSEKLIDYIAMDIKAPYNKYKSIVGSSVELDNIKESIRLIMSSGINYEFRTTFSPDLTKEDIIDIAKLIEGANLYVIQQFTKHDFVLKKSFGPHSNDYIQATAKQAEKYVKVKVKGIGKY